MSFHSYPGERTRIMEWMMAKKTIDYLPPLFISHTVLKAFSSLFICHLFILAPFEISRVISLTSLFLSSVIEASVGRIIIFCEGVKSHCCCEPLPKNFQDVIS